MRAGSLALLLVLANLASAHSIGESFASVRVAGNRVDVDLRVRTTDVAVALGLDRDQDGVLGPSELDRSRIEPWISAGVLLTERGQRREGTLRSLRVVEACLPGAERPQGVLEVSLSWEEVHGDASLEIAPFRSADPEHACLARVVRDGEESGFVFRAGARCPLSRSQGALRFVFLGVEHIISGLDHVLFLVSLLVALPSRRSLVWTISAFPLGHSATLALATFHVFVLPSSVVEPLIALSVVYVCLENLVSRPGAHRAALTLAFGLVHGMGFSSVLSDLSLSGGALAAALASFNAGVELGQLLVVACVCPLLAWGHARRPLFVRRWALQAGSIAILAVAGKWFLERI